MLKSDTENEMICVFWKNQPVNYMRKRVHGKYTILMKRFSLIIFGILLMFSEAEAAWFEYLPHKIKQPDGEIINCFVSGDEFFNWIHDAEGYTIIQAGDGYFYYAVREGDILVPSAYKVNSIDPGKAGLRKWEKISEDEYRRKHDEMFSYKLYTKDEPDNAPLTGILNNLVVYIRFQDDTEFTTARQAFDDKFNPVTGVSVKSYYEEVSYGKLELSSTHYPACALSANLSYQDSHLRSYFQPYNATSNPGGYPDESQRMAREHTLLSDAINWINSNSPVPASLEIDNDFNNYVDNVCFIVKGDQGAWNDLLWAHRWALYSKTVYINGKRVFDYTLQPESQVGVKTLCHELFHALGAPDLYHYTSNGVSPAGPWDLMHSGGGHMTAYMKWKYSKNLWITSIPLISTPGTYTLNPLTSPENNCYRIASPNSSNEFFIVEYRNKSGIFETSIPGSGLIVYRIDTRYTGNADGPPDELYIYRPDGTLTVNGNIYNAYYSPSAGRTSITDLTNPNSFLQDGSIGGLNISNVSIPGPTISFDVTLVGPCTPPAAPIPGTITQPTCTVKTGSVIINGLPPSGVWTLARNPGNIITTGTGTITTISGIERGTYTFTVTNASRCASSPSSPVVINESPLPPAPPLIGIITQPSCSVPTGSVVLNGLPTYEWTLVRNPGGVSITSVGTSRTITGLNPGTYTFTVTNSTGCISQPTGNVVIIAAPASPAAPVVGTVTQPTCTVTTGSVILNGLPSTGTWTLTRSPGGTTITGTGTSRTTTGLSAGTYTFTVKNSEGCSSVASGNIVINLQPSTPTPPVIGSITHPTCSLATGSVVLSGLPSTGTWTLTRSPGGATITGTGTSRTITGLPAGTYSYTVINSSGCISSSSSGAVINQQPPTPASPVVGTITKPDCNNATGSVVLNGLPSTGTWTLTRNPGGVTLTGNGTGRTITGLSTGTYTYVVTNASGCVSGASASIIINPQPQVPTAPVIGTITQPTQQLPTGSVLLSGLPSGGTWTITRTPGGVTITGTGTSRTVTSIPSGSYTFTVTGSSGCISVPSASVVIIDPIIFNLNKPDGQPLHDQDTIKSGTTDAGSLVLNVESNYSWGVNENSLWLSAVKDGNSSIRIAWKENISLLRKNAVVTVTNQFNMAIRINIQQKARTSVFYGQKFENISVFPNPAADYIRLDLGEEKFDRLHVRITNIYGNVVLLKEFRDIVPGYIPEIQIHGLPTGQYYLNIGDEKYIRTIRIIKF